MGLEGDLSQLDGLIECMTELSQVPSQTSVIVAEKLQSEIQDQFTLGVDPYGRRWKKLAPSTVARGRSFPPLTDTSDMRDSLKVFPVQDAGVSMEIDLPAGYHQTGWSGPRGDGPARPILPDRGYLPEAWVDIIDAAVEGEFKKATRQR